jgi:hypothetical protein
LASSTHWALAAAIAIAFATHSKELGGGFAGLQLVLLTSLSSLEQAKKENVIASETPAANAIFCRNLTLFIKTSMIYVGDFSKRNCLKICI